jgi:hypothetical protein
MLKRNELVHAVIWPVTADAQYNLVAMETVEIKGEPTVKEVILGEVPVTAPVRGSDLAKMIPDGCCVKYDGCTVVKLTGDILVRTVAPFDTAVVTEKAQMSMEERMQRLELRERRRGQREKEREQETARLRAELEAERERNAVLDDEPQVTEIRQDETPAPAEEVQSDET